MRHVKSMHTTFAYRLQYLIDIKKINQTTLVSAELGTVAQVSKWLSGSIKVPRRKTLQALAEYFGCDINWLADGKGEAFLTKEDISETPEEKLVRTYGKNPITSSVTIPFRSEPVGEKPNQEKTAREPENIDEKEILDQTRYILRSKTVYRPALLSNIRAFYQGVKREEEMQGISEKMEAMQKKHDADMEEIKKMFFALGSSIPEKRETGT